MKDRITIMEKYGPAMEIKTQEEADRYFEDCVAHSMRILLMDRKQAELLERDNLGYYAGYYGSETRQRVETLFKCSHPVFGSIEENGVPSAIDCLKAGEKLAKGEP